MPLTKRDLFIAGLFLYWGEGTKRSEARLALSNTNPAAIRFFIKWLEESFSVSRGKVKIYLHLYKNMSIKKEISFWSKTLSISKKQFTKPYIKKGNSDRINYKSGFGHGTCNAMVGDARLYERVLANLKAIENDI